MFMHTHTQPNMQRLSFLGHGKRKDKGPTYILKEQLIVYWELCTMYFKKKKLIQVILITS